MTHTVKILMLVVVTFFGCSGVPAAHPAAAVVLLGVYDCDALVAVYNPVQPDDGRYQLQARPGPRGWWHTVPTVSGGEGRLRWAHWDRHARQFRIRRTTAPALGAVSNAVAVTDGCPPI